MVKASVRLVPGAIRSSIRSVIYGDDEKPRELRFAAVDAVEGYSWTEEKKQITYPIDQESAGAYAFKLGGPFYIEDATCERHYQQDFPETRSLYTVPLQVRGCITAVLTVAAGEKGAFSDRRKRALEQMVARACGTLEYLLLLEERSVANLEHSLSEEKSLQDICDDSLRLTKILFGVRACSIFLKYPSEEVLTLVASTALDAKGIGKIYRIGEGLTGWVAKHKKVLRVRNPRSKKELEGIAEDLEWKKIWVEDIVYDGLEGPRPYLAAPLLSRNQLIGVLRLTIREDGTEFEHSDEVLVKRVADRLAVVIDTFWLAEAKKRRLEQLQLSIELGDRLAGALDVDKVCKTILEESCRMAGSKLGHIRRFNKREGTLTLVAAIGPHQNALRRVRQVGEGRSGKAIAYREGLFIADLTESSSDLNFYEDVVDQPQQKIFEQVKSAVYLPLQVDGELIGIMALGFPEKRGFRTTEREVFSDLVRRSELALKAALMFEEIENELRVKIDALARVRQIGIGFAETRKIDQLLDRVLDGALQGSGMQAGTVRIFDSSTRKWVLRAARDSTDANLYQKLTLDIDFTDDLVKKARDASAIIYVPDTSSDPDFQSHLAALSKRSHREFLETICSLILVPIRLEKRWLGIVTLLSRQQQPLSPATPEYLEALASYAALAIENAQFDEERAKNQQFEQLAMLGYVASGLEHDIRHTVQLLSNKLVLASVDKIDHDERISRLSAMKTQIKQLGEICRQLRLLAKREHSVAFDFINFDRLIDEALTYRPNPANIQVSVSPVLEPPPKLKGNAMLLKLALQLVFENAFEAMPKGGELSVAISESNGHVEVRIADTGIGMDHATKEKIFDPFFTTKKKKGRGMGLSVVSTIMRLHSGTIDVNNNETKGSVFLLRLPKESTTYA